MPKPNSPTEPLARRAAPRPGPERPGPQQDHPTRTMSLLAGRGAPSSLDEEARSVEVIAATEDPAQIYDWRRGIINEVLLMSGLKPLPRQVPLLDSHNAWSVRGAMLGSLREFRIDGNKLIARAVFSETAADVFTLVKEGHLTDVSVGYQRIESTWIEEGETKKIKGQSYQGPLLVVTKWALGEVSVVPIGADPSAKARAASTNQEVKPMDPRLREFLERSGLSPDATEEEAWQYLARLRAGSPDDNQRAAATPPPPADPAPPAPEPGDGQRAVAMPALPEPAPPVNPEAERQRAADILAQCRVAGLPEDAARELILSPRTADQAASEVLRRQAAASGIAGGGGYRGPTLIVDERDKFRAAASDSLLVRGSIPVAKPAAGHDEMMGRSLPMLALECLQRANQPTRGNMLDWVGRALTTSDLPYILQDVANKSLLVGWETAPENWSKFCATGSVGDFKPGKAVRLGEFDGLDEMGEDDEYKFASLADAQETYQIATYGKAIRLSRKLIINDDLSMLTSIPQAMGEAASRTVGDVAWAALIGNGAMGDGKALFHADHANIANIAAFGLEGLAALIQLMTSQKDMRGKRRIVSQPTFIMMPNALWLVAEKFFGSVMVGTAAEPNVKNPLAGAFAEGNRIYEPRLDDSNQAVFYLAGPKGRTVTVYFLNGVQTPFIDWADEWNTDGRKGKVRIDVGSKAMDWRGLARGTITG